MGEGVCKECGRIAVPGPPVPEYLPYDWECPGCGFRVFYIPNVRLDKMWLPIPIDVFEFKHS